MSDNFKIKVKRGKKAGEAITLVEVIYRKTSDADRRMAAAIKLLLQAGAESGEDDLQELTDDN